MTRLWSNSHIFLKQITAIHEIISFQYKHYMIVNGRSLMHAIEQMFTNHELLFSIWDTLIFMAFIMLVSCCVKSKKSKLPYAAWLSIVLCLLFLCPYQASLWTSVNYSVNYLLPSFLATSVILLWRSIENGSSNRAYYYPLISILGFICGWSHEAFAVPLAAALAVYYILWRKRFVRRVLWLMVPLWIGTTILFFAPGNFVRLEHAGGTSFMGWFIRIKNGFECLMRLRLVWIMSAALIIALLRGHWSLIRMFVKDNPRLVLIFVMAIGFSMLANSASYSFCFVELMSMLITLKYMIEYGVFAPRRITTILALVLTCLFVPQQMLLAVDTKVAYDHQQQIKQVIKDSEDGLFLNPPAPISDLSRPFIRQWSDPFCLYTAAITVGQPEKRASLIALNPADYQAVADAEHYYIGKNKHPGNAPVYQAEGSNSLWVKPGALKGDDKIQATYYPVDWNHTEAPYPLRVKFAFCPDAYENTEILKIDTVRCRFGEFYRIPLPTPRKIKELNVVR